MYLSRLFPSKAMFFLLRVAMQYHEERDRKARRRVARVVGRVANKIRCKSIDDHHGRDDRG
jgi:hypothetical protein